jgi:hypothetical protein
MLVAGWVMQALFQKNRLAGKVASLQRHKLAICGLGCLGAASLLASSLLVLHVSEASLSAPDHGQLSFRHVVTQRPDSRWGSSAWVGGLEQPAGRTSQAAQHEQQLTSASYTSGFDKKAVGLGPLPQMAQVQKPRPAGGPLACPDDLNCSFRPAKAGGVATQHRFPASNVESASNGANNAVSPGLFTEPPKSERTGKASQAERPNGFALLTNLRFPTHLPTKLPPASTLLKPFTFVSNTVVGFVKKL